MSTVSETTKVPVVSITAKCLPEAWEKAMLAVWDNGVDVKTQYDKPSDPPSKDATVIVTVEEPLSEPRIHKNFPGGPVELETYRQEVINGIHDHWIDPNAGKWTYTYHQRLFAYCPVDNIGCTNSSNPFEPVNQIQCIVDKLAETLHTRRAQAITWIPTADANIDDPPCLQRVWGRLIEDANGKVGLNMNTHWRSRDLYKAWFMNAYAFTDLARLIAEQISQKIKRQVTVSRYVDISDSLHIYGSYFEDAAAEVEKMRNTSFALRSWSSDHPAFKMMTLEAKEKLSGDPDWYAKSKG